MLVFYVRLEKLTQPKDAKPNKRVIGNKALKDLVPTLADDPEILKGRIEKARLDYPENVELIKAMEDADYLLSVDQHNDLIFANQCGEYVVTMFRNCVACLSTGPCRRGSTTYKQIEILSATLQLARWIALILRPPCRIRVFTMTTVVVF